MQTAEATDRAQTSSATSQGPCRSRPTPAHPHSARALPGQRQARPRRAPAARGSARAPPAPLARARARGRSGAPLLPAAGVEVLEEAEAGQAAGSGGRAPVNGAGAA